MKYVLIALMVTFSAQFAFAGKQCHCSLPDIPADCAEGEKEVVVSKTTDSCGAKRCPAKKECVPEDKDEAHED